MAGKHKCKFCTRVLNTAQGLKSHNTRFHKDQVLREDRPWSSQPACRNSEKQCETGFASQPLPSTENNSSLPLENLLANLKLSSKVLRRIPKAARSQAAGCLTSTIDTCLEVNSVQSWKRLLLFSAGCLQVPINKSDRKVSLATLVKQNVSDFLNGKVIEKCDLTKSKEKTKSPNADDLLVRIVEGKISDGDITGAVRVLSSEESFAPRDKKTVDALISKHPAAVQHQQSGSTPQAEEQTEDTTNRLCLKVTEADVRAAISSFPAGSAGGLDMLRPQHLKDMVGPSAGNAGLRLISSLTKLCNIMLEGIVPKEICPVLYGASLIALKKKDGGIRPIAVGNTLRRLVAKMGSYHIKESLGRYFQPVQLGFGTKGGAEAVAHAARRYVSFQHKNSTVILKIDFRNAFNTIDRNCILKSASSQFPELYPFLDQCYRRPSHLAFGEELILSQRGIQQGDPLGPALFCSVIHPTASSMNSDLNVWYLDDGTLGGRPDTVVKDFVHLTKRSAELGLEINLAKCEVLVLSESVNEELNINQLFTKLSPDIKFPTVSEYKLLGAPLNTEALADCLNLKIQALDRISKKLSLLTSHVGYFILKNSQSIPKLSYVLRCAPTWKCGHELLKFDEKLKEALESITNTKLEGDAWDQSALPVCEGGLGLRHAHKLALPAFLSSSFSVQNAVKDILPRNVSEDIDHTLAEGMSLWCTSMASDSPSMEKRSVQKEWERPAIELSKINIYERAANNQNKARLLSVASKESGAFLNALPSASLGTLLNNEAFRVAVALRVGSKICQPHVCVCGSKVDEMGIHGLHCLKSAGRNIRHSAVNDVIKRGLASAGFPSILEPSFLANENNKRPDGITQIPWSGGKSLVWDFTCTDSLAPSYVTNAAVEPLFAATGAETSKKRKYVHLDQNYIFTPVAVECLGSLGRESLSFIRRVGKKITEATGEKRATEYLLQRISIAVQRGNAISVSGTIPRGASLEEFLDLL